MEYMDAKARLLNQFLPVAVLEALTPEARAAMPSTQCIGQFLLIRQFPCRIGRESRVRIVNGKAERVERPRLASRTPNNDIYLIDQGELFNISREHLIIERKDQGYAMIDRGSACGTKVGEQHIGGEDRGGSAALKDGDVIAIGAKETPYLYRFITFEEYMVVNKKETEQQ